MESKYLSTSEATAFGGKDPQSVDNRNQNHTKCINMSWDIGSLYSPFLVCCCLDPFFVCCVFFSSRPSNQIIGKLRKTRKLAAQAYGVPYYYIKYTRIPKIKSLEVTEKLEIFTGECFREITIHHPSPCLVVGRFTGKRISHDFYGRKCRTFMTYLGATASAKVH